MPEEMYRALFEHMVQGVIFLDHSGKVIAANPAARQLLGLSLEQMHQPGQTDPHWHVIHPDGSEWKPEDHPGATVLRTGLPVNDVVAGIYFPESGLYRWINVNAAPRFRPGEDKPHQCILTLQEVSEQRRVEDALRESEEKYRKLFEMESDAIFLIENEEGRILDVNLAATALYGYSREELLQMRNVDLSAEPDETRRITRTGASAVPLRYHRKKDGTVFPVEITATFMTLNGRAVHIPAIRDITQRIQAEDDLQQRNRYLAALQETMIDLISQVDVNELLQNIAKRAGQLMNTTAYFLDLVDPATGQLVPRVGAGALDESLSHPVKMGEGVAGIAWQTQKPCVVNDYDNWPERIENYSLKKLYSVIGVPLVSGDQVLGVLGLSYDYESKKTFSTEAVEFLTQFARLATIAIENARLFALARQELAERKQAECRLEEQLKELRRWQAVTLGREMRILDLKREVNDLLAAAGQPARYASPEQEKQP